jgi:hypothetical protein
MIKAALIQQALAEYVYIYGGYKQVELNRFYPNR